MHEVQFYIALQETLFEFFLDLILHILVDHITSVGEKRTNLSAICFLVIMWFLFGEWVLGMGYSILL